MLTFTAAAQRQISGLIARSSTAVRGLRLKAQARSPFKIDYHLAFIAPGQEVAGDERVRLEGFEVFVEAGSAPLLAGATVDYVDNLTGSGFRIEAPRRLPPTLSGPLVEQIQAVIEERINPLVAGHGGRVSLLDIRDGVVYIEFGGGCQGCSMADLTLKQGVKAMIKEAVPEIAEVCDATDHAKGDKPYYSSGGRA